nr:hypothetical protein [uncultured Moraxella sp.]
MQNQTVSLKPFITCLIISYLLSMALLMWLDRLGLDNFGVIEAVLYSSFITNFYPPLP